MRKIIFLPFKMTTLAEWQSFARSTNLKGWSRLKKDELKDFLMENLWKEGSGKPKMKTTRKKQNPLMKKNKKINVPFLIPERRLFPSRDFPRAIKENVNNVVDWADWLESVRDAEIRKRSTPEVEKLKKQIAELWGEKLTVEKGKSAFGKFAKQFNPPRVFPESKRGNKIAFAAKSADESSMHSECGNDSKSNFWRR